MEIVLGIKCVLFLSMTFAGNNFHRDFMSEMLENACSYSRKVTIIFA
jgi:hypothetical protein